MIKILGLVLSGVLVGYYQPRPTSYSSENLTIEKLTDHTFIHTSFIEYQGNKVACNGLIYINNNEAFILDSPNDEVSTQELINWLQVEQKLKVTGVLATHFHSDCLGGFGTFHKSNIPTYGNQLTKILAESNGSIGPRNTFTSEFSFYDNMLNIKYFGAGHTEDNVVVYLSEEKVLFGGCLIKSLDASKGNLGDENLLEWSNTVRKIKNELSEVKHVVPGHGDAGDAALLDYTIRLFE
jgi:metallo-beta-lactamase class B